VAEGAYVFWSTRPGSNGRPPRWQGDAGVGFIEVFRPERSYRCVSVNSGGKVCASLLQNFGPPRPSLRDSDVLVNEKTCGTAEASLRTPNDSAGCRVGIVHKLGLVIRNAPMAPGSLVRSVNLRQRSPRSLNALMTSVTSSSVKNPSAPNCSATSTVISAASARV
jgi:hypothetical protein